MLGNGQRTRLGDNALYTSDGYHGGAFAHLGGRFASIDEGYWGGRYDGGIKADLSVTDLVSGRVVHRWTADNARVLSVVLAPSGAIAWVDEVPGYEPFEVRKSDADGDAIVLDSAALYGIGPASLRLDAGGTTLSWTHGGEPRTAALRSR
jgi:hypothetical protein